MRLEATAPRLSIGGALVADDMYLAALADGDLAALDALLADDFHCADLLGSWRLCKLELLRVVDDERLRVELVAPARRHVRSVGQAVEIQGSIDVFGERDGERFGGREPFRHLFVPVLGRWRLRSITDGSLWRSFALAPGQLRQDAAA